MLRNEMQQNATLEGLSPSQTIALEALLAGKTNTAAAAAAGVDRVTVYRWLKDDFAFQAELNRGRRELREATIGNLQRLAAKAAVCVEKAIDQDDVKVALEVLKRFPPLALGPIESDDPAELALKAEVEAAERQDHLKMRAITGEWERLQQKIGQDGSPDRLGPLLLPTGVPAKT